MAVDGRAVAVAAHMETFIVEAVMAGEGDVGVDDALLQTDESLRDFERGARRVGAHDGAVKERFHRVLAQQAMVLPSVAADHDARVVSGRGGHAEYFPRFRFYGHDSAEFTCQQPFSQCLQIFV